MPIVEIEKNFIFIRMTKSEIWRRWGEHWRLLPAGISYTGNKGTEIVTRNPQSEIQTAIRFQKVKRQGVERYIVKAVRLDGVLVNPSASDIFSITGKCIAGYGALRGKTSSVLTLGLQELRRWLLGLEPCDCCSGRHPQAYLACGRCEFGYVQNLNSCLFDSSEMLAQWKGCAKADADEYAQRYGVRTWKPFRAPSMEGTQVLIWA